MTLNPKLDDSCVLALSFDEESGNIAYDQSSYGNDGTIYEAERVKGVIGKALSFDGVDDSAKVETQFFDPYTTKQFTLTMWVNIYIDNTQTPPDTIRWKGICLLRIKDNVPGIWIDVPVWTTSPPVKGIRFYLNSRKKADCASVNIGHNFDDVFVDITKGWTGWKFVAFCVDARDEANVIVRCMFGNEYKEWTRDVSDAWIFATYPPDNPCGLNLAAYLGIPKHADSCWPYYRIIVDEVRIYNRALSEKEIKTLYHYGIQSLRHAPYLLK